MAKDLSHLLNDLGLSESETKIYLSGLETGPTSVQDLAKKAKLSRTAAYDAVAHLQSRGLMTTYERGKKVFYVSENPDRAVTFFRERIRKLRGKLEVLEEQLPELKMMMGGDRPAVRFYEGRDALLALFQDVVSVNPVRVDELSNMDDVYQYLNTEDLLEVRRTLNVDKIQLRILYRGTLQNPRKNVIFCELLKEIDTFHGDIWIYENRVAFVQFVGKVLTVIIESESLADTARALYQAAWIASAAENGITQV